MNAEQSAAHGEECSAPPYCVSSHDPGVSCFKSMEAFLPSVAEQLLREIKCSYQETSQISDEHLLGLKFIFGPTALYALDLVDQRSVTHVTSPSGRSTFQCKHILAVYLSQAMGICQELTVSDKQVSEILLAKED